jgi:hypothetical protein
MILNEIAVKLGSELFDVCVFAGERLADTIDRGVDDFLELWDKNNDQVDV